MTRLLIALWFLVIPILWTYGLPWTIAPAIGYAHFMVSAMLACLLYGIVGNIEPPVVFPQKIRLCISLLERLALIGFSLVLLWTVVVPLAEDFRGVLEGTEPITITAHYNKAGQRRLIYKVTAINGEHRGQVFYEMFRLSRSPDNLTGQYVALSHSRLVLKRQIEAPQTGS